MYVLQVGILALALQAAGQQPQPGSIEGIVVKSGTGEPLGGATVQLNLRAEGAIPREALHRYARTGGDGKFVFSDVMPGEYQLIATRSGGWVPAEYGQRAPTGQGIPFEIAPGQRMTGIQLAMAATGSISGRIFDGDGEPLGRAQVQALRAIYSEGRRKFTIVQMVETNDRGEYRLFWLPPGRYYISAKPYILRMPGLQGPNAAPASVVRITEPARFASYELATAPAVKRRNLGTGETIEEIDIPVYYPGIVDAQAAVPIAVAPGAAAGGIDISTGPGRAPSRHIRGRVINAENGQPSPEASVIAVPRTPDPLISAPSGRSGPDGSFDLAGALPGTYSVFATNFRDVSMSGVARVEVGERDVQNVPIVIGNGFKIAGRFIIDGRSPSGRDPNVANLRAGFTRDPNIPGTPQGGPSFVPPPAPDGSFILEGVSAGDFRVTIRGVPDDAYIKSIRLGNTGILEEGLHLAGPPDSLLEVVIGANAGRIEGSVTNDRQELLSNMAVILVPDPRLRHRSDLYKTAVTDNAGQFRFRGITPGEYKLFAFEEVETGAWQDPDFIRAYENRGVPVQVTEGSNGNVRLTSLP